MAATPEAVRIRIEAVGPGQGDFVTKADPRIGNDDDTRRLVDVKVRIQDNNNLKALKRYIVAMSQNQVTGATLTQISSDWTASS